MASRFPPKWSILTLTVPSREAKFLRLVSDLLSQASRHGTEVEVIALRDRGGRSAAELAPLRQALLDDARGEFVSFVDDDDTVARDFVMTVLAAIDSAPVDFVAFSMQIWEDGQSDPRAVLTGLHYDGWSDSPHYYYRDITHINPVRVELARKAGFRQPPGSESAEDWQYVSALRPLLAGRNWAAVDRVLYHYRHSWQDSVQNRTVRRQPVNGRLPAIPGPLFRWHPGSFA